MSCEFVIRVVQEFQTWVCCVVKTLLGRGVRSPTHHQNLPCTEEKKKSLLVHFIVFCGLKEMSVWHQSPCGHSPLELTLPVWECLQLSGWPLSSVIRLNALYQTRTISPSAVNELRLLHSGSSQEVHESEKEKEVFHWNNCRKSEKSHLLNRSIQILSYGDQVLVPILHICKHEMARQYGVNNLMHD